MCSLYSRDPVLPWTRIHPNLGYKGHGYTLALGLSSFYIVPLWRLAPPRNAGMGSGLRVVAGTGGLVDFCARLPAGHAGVKPAGMAIHAGWTPDTSCVTGSPPLVWLTRSRHALEFQNPSLWTCPVLSFRSLPLIGGSPTHCCGEPPISHQKSGTFFSGCS